MEGSWYPWYSDGTRNPLFPWLAAVFLDPGDPAFFEKGKKLNVILAICGAACLGIFFSRRLGPLAALSATALASLGALLPISTFFGAEAAFLVLFFFVCVCGARLLNDNPVRFYVFFGLLLAIAWLAKSSTTLFFGLFILFSFGRWILNLAWSQSPLASPRPQLELPPLWDRPDALSAGILRRHLSPLGSRQKKLGQRVLQPPKLLVLGG